MWNQVRTRSYVTRASSSEESEVGDRVPLTSDGDSELSVLGAEDESLNGFEENDATSSEPASDMVPTEVAELIEMVCAFKTVLNHRVDIGVPSDSEDEQGKDESKSDSHASGATRTEPSTPLLAAPATSRTGAETTQVVEQVHELLLDAARQHPRQNQSADPKHPDATRARELWKVIANEAEACYSLAATCLGNMDARGVAAVFNALAEGIVAQTREILAGVLDTRSITVWGGVRAARAAVLADTVKCVTDAEEAEAAEPFAVIVMYDVADGVRAEAEPAVLDGWIQVCDGLARTVPVPVDAAAAAVRYAENAIAACGGVRPILVVVHAAPDSVVSAAAKGIRSVCDRHGVRVCLDGGAIAMAAQHGRAKVVDDALAAAHTLVLQPATWLGFPVSAALTCTITDCEGIAEPNSHTHDSNHCAALPAVLAHWWVFSRLGANKVRAVVADAAAAAETLARKAKAIPGLDATVYGVGGTVRLTYVPESAQSAAQAAAAPGAAAGTARSHVARVNQALCAETRRECRELGAEQLTFAPARCLAALWAPPAAAVDTLVGALDHAVRRVRVCAAARAAFNSAARRADGIEAAADAGPRDVLTLASFRVVPSAYADGWATPERQRHVHQCTSDAFYSLDDAFAELAQDDRRFARKVDKVHKMRTPYSSFLARVVGSKGTDISVDMPFQAFLQEDKAQSRPAWIALVPTPTAKIDDAEIAAELAAELVAVAADRVLAGCNAK